jgi:hypothetical protein
MSAPARPCIPWPTSDDVDLAPQLIVVALALAALFAVDRALDGAHPILAQTRRLDRSPPPLISSELLAVQILELAAELAALLRDYDHTVRIDFEHFDDDPVDPF